MSIPAQNRNRRHATPSWARTGACPGLRRELRLSLAAARGQRTAAGADPGRHGHRPPGQRRRQRPDPVVVPGLTGAPGETVQAVPGARTASQVLAAVSGFFMFLHLNRYRIIVIIPQRVLILDAGPDSMRTARGVAAGLPRSTRLGPASGLWHVISAAGRTSGSTAAFQRHPGRRRGRLTRLRRSRWPAAIAWDAIRSGSGIKAFAGVLRLSEAALSRFARGGFHVSAVQLSERHAPAGLTSAARLSAAASAELPTPFPVFSLVVAGARRFRRGLVR
jgi:hypothetical protein